MIYKTDRQYNVWLGEGDVGIGVVLGDDDKACGIGFVQLKEQHEIGVDVKDEFKEDEALSVNILFANRSGIESLFEGIKRFLERLDEEEKATK